jgi:hypothetical protein
MDRPSPRPILASEKQGPRRAEAGDETYFIQASISAEQMRQFRKTHAFSRLFDEVWRLAQAVVKSRSGHSGRIVSEIT